MHKFNPSNAARLLNPERRRWQDPEALLDSIGARPGAAIADVGAGPGFFTIPAALLVGQRGKVYALDVQPEMLQILGERVAAERLTNVELLLSKEAELPLGDAAVDFVLLANVLHESADRVSLLREIGRILRPGGILGLVEWRKEETPMGPPLAERLSSEEAEAALDEAEFGAVEQFAAGPHHYGLRARAVASAQSGDQAA